MNNAPTAVAATAFGLLRPAHEILFGSGVVAALPRVLSGLGRRVFVCVDPVLRTSAAFADFVAAAPDHGLRLEVFSEFAAELPLADVDKAVAAARGHQPEVLLGFGGGSALDLAKLVALGCATGGAISDFYGENAVPGALRPIVAVPTTAGTGSEVTPVAVVGDPKRELKVGVSSPYLVPTAAVVDPELTHTCPARVTAFSGIDALCHAVESYTARTASLELSGTLPVFVGTNELSRLLAREAAERIVTALPRAVAHGDDAEARASMAYASLLAGMAFGTGGTHLAHAIQYPIGAMTHTPHGLGVGLLLPYVLEACLPDCGQRLAELGRSFAAADSAASSADSTDSARDGTENQSEPSAEAWAAAAIRRIVAVRRAIGVPHTLAELDLEESQLTRIIDLSATVARLVNNAPSPEPQALLEPIVRSAWSGASKVF